MPEPRASERAAPSAPPAPPKPLVDLEQALKESGLQMVETRSDTRVETAPEEQSFVPAKRERRAAPPSISEPLVQVETGRPPQNPPA